MAERLVESGSPYTPSGVATAFTTGFEPSSVTADITTGPNGVMWFTDSGTNSIGSITSTGVIVEYPIPTAASSPAGLAFGPDGSLWFVESTGASGVENVGRFNL